ncbi:hypothetical protein BDW72DRAFT_165941, partial [Aspergillus terricola var. indicus]
MIVLNHTIPTRLSACLMFAMKCTWCLLSVCGFPRSVMNTGYYPVMVDQRLIPSNLRYLERWEVGRDLSILSAERQVAVVVGVMSCLVTVTFSYFITSSFFFLRS